MSVDEFRDRVAKEYYDFTVRQGWKLAGYEAATHFAAHGFAGGLLDLEVLPGITLRRVVELKDKLVVLDDNQTLPDTSYGAFEHLDPFWVEEAVKNDMVTAGFRRVSPPGEKEGC